MMETNNEHAPPPTAVGPLRRSTADKVFAGVAGGIAARLDIPAWVVRVGFVVLSLGGGFGVALYVAGWLLMAREDEDEPIARRLFDRVEGGAGWVGVALIGVGVLIAADSVGFIRGDLALAVFLGVVGVLLYRGELGGDRGSDTATTVTTAAGGEAATSTTPQAPADTPPPTEPPPAHPETPPAPQPPKPSRPPSILGRLTFASGLIALGLMALVDFAAASFDPTPRHYLGLAVGTVGMGLIVGSWFGRARGLIFVGVILLPWLIAAPLAEFDWDASIGERNIDPQSVAQIADSYSLSIGEMVIDLRGVDFGDETVEFDASLGIGSLQILLPDGVGSDIRARVGLGEAQVFGTTRAGGAREIEIDRPGSGLVVIDARTNLGEVRIVETGATARSGGVGSIDEVIGSVSELEEVYSLNAGDITLDLSGLLLEMPRTVSVTTGAGAVRVIVPDEAATLVRASSGLGRIDLFGSESSGVGVELVAEPAGEPLLILDIDVDAGQIEVEEG